MRLFRSREVIGIAAEALDFALEAAAETHPNEYMGLLRGEDATQLGLDRDGLVVTDVLIIPGTVSDPFSATIKTNFVPNDFRAVGSIHSHPNGVLRPSDADLDTFGSGTAHIIMGHPYGPNDWEVFDQSGDPRDFEVIDVDLPDPESFFDFTQADIDAELDR
ncbi:proteasome protein [Haloferax sp. MBLA0076]|uniref:Proteasome protein n=1 Tax=Haloferax litoreum TaxID=2666140 RepID=A0A6A8GCB8_9EURY|nr:MULTISPECIES: Mov34/MPN/PAD-1 family protein [Haloferax]KAB1191919.1 proteasome protein [Haloferax sp. CBA1148]MRX20356.1 proteasome protein [Haloferax litoreum]